MTIPITESSEQGGVNIFSSSERWGLSSTRRGVVQDMT